MKTIQMTIDDDLLGKLDRMVKAINISRSAFIRKSIQHYLANVNIQELEKKHREGYSKNPVQKNEFSVWESEQVWVD